MKIPNNDQSEGMPISGNFLTYLKNILFNTKLHLHHSHTKDKYLAMLMLFATEK